MSKSIIAVLLTLTPSISLAQTLPFTLPADTVIGRSVDIGPGEATAIPFSVLAVKLAPLAPTVVTCPAHQFVNFITGTASGCAQPTSGDISGLAAIATSGSGNDIITGTVSGARLAQIDLTSSGNGGVGGTLPAVNGGTGQAAFAVGDLLTANTTTTLQRLADAATGNALISGGVGVVPSWGKVGLTTHISGILPETNGGTNQSTYATGDLLQATGSNTLGKLASVATGNALISGGVTTVSSWGKIGLTTHVTGTLPIANGGTNDTGTAWSNFTPSPSCGTATFTVNSATSKSIGKTTFLEADITVATLGTCGVAVSFTLPITANKGGAMIGREQNNANVAVFCTVSGGSATITCGRGANTNYVANDRFVLSGVIESQ